MEVTVTRIDGRLTADVPGVSALHVAADPEIGLLVITCPSCGERTLRYLTSGDQFAVRHQKTCQCERTIRRLVETHPERVGKSYGTLVFQQGDCFVVVRDPMPLTGSEP